MMLMLPDLLIIATAFAVLGLDVLFFDRNNRAHPKWLSSVALGGVFLSAAVLLGMMDLTGEALGGRFALDPLGSWFKLTFLFAAFLTLTLAAEPFQEKAHHPLRHGAEFVTVLLFTVSGMMFLVSSRDLVSMYVSLELATIPLFALTAWSRTERSAEGALKYLTMGALASAFLLYGLGLLYGLTGSTSFAGIASALNASPAVWLAAGLITAGVGFKLTLFPFHMWAPDAYQGAPTPITAYLSVASKAAGLVMAFHIYYRVFGKFLPQWAVIVAIFASLTMTLGNIVAVLQNNLKRFMAYSAISQAGYLILGFLGSDAKDASAMVFYMMIYVVTNLAAFAVLVLHIHQTGREDIAGLRGMSRTNPLLALALMVALFGLAGIPPLSGFVGKFFLFSVAAKAGFYWLVGLAAVNSTVSLYYYLRLVRQMYIEPAADQAVALRVSPMLGAGLGLATLGSVAIGLIPFFYERMTTDAAQWLLHLTR